jgi:hypothetical protein
MLVWSDAWWTTCFLTEMAGVFASFNVGNVRDGHISRFCITILLGIAEEAYQTFVPLFRLDLFSSSVFFFSFSVLFFGWQASD